MTKETRLETAARYAKAYRALGFNPLPSKLNKKSPNLITHSQFFDEPCPEDLFDSQNLGNLQLTCGTRWDLLVVDLDGPQAIEHWKHLRSQRYAPPTWIVTTGGGGEHHYYSFSTSDRNHPLKSKKIWGQIKNGEWVKHCAIEILGDRKLVIAPPSIHVKTGLTYTFASGHSPKDIIRPAIAPPWIIFAPSLPNPGSQPNTTQPKYRPPEILKNGVEGKRMDRFPPDRASSTRVVLDSIADKVSLARSWGLSIAVNQANDAGWVSCYRAGTTEQNPSAGISERTGNYWEEGLGTITLFDLAVRLGVARTWLEAKNETAARLGLD